MQYRTIGKTGVKISEIGFGCGNNAVLMVKAPYDEQVKVVRHALDAGINFFDTAFAYGLGKSEENLGRILKDLGANPVISTKIRLEADAVGDVKAATIRAVEAGLQRLDRERVDFVQLHTRVTLERGMGKRFSLTPQDVLGPNGVDAMASKSCASAARSATSVLAVWAKPKRCTSWSTAANSTAFSVITICSIRAPASRFRRVLARWTTV